MLRSDLAVSMDRFRLKLTGSYEPHMRLSDLIESYYSNLTDQVETDSH